MGEEPGDGVEKTLIEKGEGTGDRIQKKRGIKVGRGVTGLPPLGEGDNKD